MAIVWVIDRLEVDVSGSGDVRYYGSPTFDNPRVGTALVR
jgi:hypothetical protein